MAIGLRRKTRLDSRRENQKITRTTNSRQKREERARRDERIIAQIKACKTDSYSGEVNSWLSRQLGKPSSKITADEIKQLIA